MTRDRLSAALRLRELRERERLLARAVAGRAADEAAARVSEASLALAADRTDAPRATSAAGLGAARLRGMALGEEVALATGARIAADRELQDAEVARVEAAVARRSVQRLQERRATEQVAAVHRVTVRRDDELALQVWRRTR